MQSIFHGSANQRTLFGRPTTFCACSDCLFLPGAISSATRLQNGIHNLIRRKPSIDPAYQILEKSGKENIEKKHGKQVEIRKSRKFVTPHREQDLSENEKDQKIQENL